MLVARAVEAVLQIYKRYMKSAGAMFDFDAYI